VNTVSTFPVPVIDLPFLAHEINDAHRQAVFHGKSMLLEACRAGEHLLKAKEQVRHGEFKAWVERNCDAPYNTVVQYMRVAKAASTKNVDLHTFEGGIRAFLDACATPRPKTPEAFPTLTREDAEYILKLHAVAERGGTENERDVAQRKLADFAGRFGMREDVAVDWATSKVPDADATAGEAQRRRDEARISELEARLKEIEQRAAILNGSFRALSKEQLVELCINLTLKAEGYFDGIEKAA